jgi:hypothetical protein
MGWRYQIPALVDMGFRVVAPDMMGYGSTVSDHCNSLEAVHGHLIEFTASLSHRLIKT